jgi:hypothetical protein
VGFQELLVHTKAHVQHVNAYRALLDMLHSTVSIYGAVCLQTKTFLVQYHPVFSLGGDTIILICSVIQNNLYIHIWHPNEETEKYIQKIDRET